jgi:hypothetical protein
MTSKQDASETFDFGAPLRILSDSDIKILARRAWDSCQGQELRQLRSEATSRGIQVA